MTPRPDEHVRPLLGAFALGHLEPEEAAAVRAHLERCRTCRDEAGELVAVAELLPLADPDRVRVPAELEPPRAMLESLLSRIEHERGVRARAERRSIALRAGAVAAALAITLVVATVALNPTSESRGAEVVAMTASRSGVLGEAVIHDDPRSTWVELTTSGLSAGESYAVWLEEVGTGERSPLGTFTSVEGDLYISLYSTLPRDRAASIGVSAADGSIVLAGNLPDPALA